MPTSLLVRAVAFWLVAAAASGLEAVPDPDLFVDSPSSVTGR